MNFVLREQSWPLVVLVILLAVTAISCALVFAVGFARSIAKIGLYDNRRDPFGFDYISRMRWERRAMRKFWISKKLRLERRLVGIGVAGAVGALVAIFILVATFGEPR